VSERRACNVLGQPRSTQRYTSTKPEKDKSVAARTKELAGENPLSGYRQITTLLGREGWRVNQKRVHRLRPTHLRSDNGPEYTSEAVGRYLQRSGVKTRNIEPGAPWQSGYIESFNSTLCDELLGRELSSTLYEAEVFAEQFRVRYNTHRPHSSLNYQPPEFFASRSTCTNPINRELAQLLT